MICMKYRNEFGEIRRVEKNTVNVSKEIMQDLERLKLYPDEPFDAVIERLLQSMNPNEMTQAISEKIKGVNAKMAIPWKTEAWKEGLEQRYEEVHLKRKDSKKWVQSLYEQAMKEAKEFRI